ncbi:MAG: subtype I-C CRISPR-associated endonuclease Cas1 [Deltaproteobacteria bacterium RIFOXYA12_FULL_58_15]|nr:MAG: subtype I-C CRISPR-associated endonuclease Cas1 [Deltaproteobacteria bacterium RIFOXYA12_FULL_58_15]
MKKHLNTLFVTTQGTYLATEGETVVVKVEHKVKLRVPLHMLEGIVCFGNVSASPFLLGRCAERDVGVSFLTERGRFLARLQGPVSGNVLLRRQQYRWADDGERSATVARACVAAKIANCRRVLQRAIRDHGGHSKGLLAAVDSLARSMTGLAAAASVDSIRGIEGDSARVYFSVFDDLVTTSDDAFRFKKRTRRPPTDAVNALLSFIYTLLLHDIASALEAVGLDPQVGFLHRDRPGRTGLALDLMEEFRPFLADRLTLSLINRKQIESGGFEARETGGVYMDDDTRKTVLVAYQERKAEEIKHPFLGEETTVGMLVHLQARLLARHLRGDIDAYPAFFWK